MKSCFTYRDLVVRHLLGVDVANLEAHVGPSDGSRVRASFDSIGGSLIAIVTRLASLNVILGRRSTHLLVGLDVVPWRWLRLLQIVTKFIWSAS